jgi:hypothetical protein
MSSVVISGDTSGTVSLTVPSVAGTNTATLPAATGTVMVSGNMPAFGAQIGATQTVTTGVTTKIQFGTENFDTANAYDNATNYRFTPQVAGYYQINIGIYASGSGLSQLNLYVYKNGSQTGTQSAFINNNSTTSQSVFFSQLMFLNGSTDYIEGYGLLSGTSGNFQAGNLSYFQATLARTS